jgi:hypothetical protein
MKFKKEFITLVLLLTSIVVLPVNSSGTATIQVTPTQSHVYLNVSFNITINIADVKNLNNLQIALRFNPKILNCKNVTVPSNNILGSDIIISPSTIDNSKGFVKKGMGIWGSAYVNGSGVLMLIEFQTVGLGKSYLNFTYTKSQSPAINSTYLCDPNNNPISFNAINGTVTSAPESSGLTPNFFNVSKKGQTYTIAIFSNSTITAFSYNETTDRIFFNATGPDGTTGACCVVIPLSLTNAAYFTVRLDNVPISSLLFQNGTHSLIPLNYAHSTRRILIIPITSNGDLNGDGKVNIKDVATVARAYGTQPGDTRWNPIADINYDDKVNIWDVAFVSTRFGRIYV